MAVDKTGRHCFAFQINHLSARADKFINFSIGTDGAAQTVTAVDASGSTVTLTITPGVASADTVTLSYTAASAGGTPIEDSAGNAAADLVAQAVTNNTADSTAPVLQTATVSGTSLVLTYDEALNAASDPATGAFSVGTDGAAQAVTAVDASGSTVTLTL
ncbi:hypothetical protein IH799_04740, partial [candidate division KSB1 bacterium]|nr:hypothetical protein [candidate division KSB1 bacterium]